MRGRRIVAGLLALVLVTSMAAPALAAASVNHDADAAQNPMISTDVTKASHTIGEMNATDYEDNSGTLATLDASVNQSTDTADVGTGYVNVYNFKASDINATDYGAFPHDKSDVSALDASEWSTDGSSGGSVSVSDVTTAPSVDAVQISTSSQTDTDVVTATFDNFSVTSDVEKRYVQTVLDVGTLDSSAEVELRINDADADYVSAQINSSRTASDEDVIANATGEGLVYQRQIGSMTVQGGGDGTMGEIQSIEVNVEDADATVDIAGLNVEKTSEWTFGDERHDSDDDDEFETDTITEVSSAGDIMIYDLATMGSTFDGATVHDITMPMEFAASDLETGDESLINMTFNEVSDDYPSFEWMQDTYYRLELPDAYDLSYSNAKLTQEVSVPDSRYDTLEIVEGADGNDFGDLSSWTDVSSAITSQGDMVTLDDTVQPGQQIVVHYEVLTTEDEKSQLEATGAAGQFGGSGGGFLDLLFSPLGLLAGGASALLARARGLI